MHIPPDFKPGPKAHLLMQVHLVPLNAAQGSKAATVSIPLQRKDLAPLAFAKVLGDNMPTLVKEFVEANPDPDMQFDLVASPK